MQIVYIFASGTIMQFNLYLKYMYVIHNNLLLYSVTCSNEWGLCFSRKYQRVIRGNGEAGEMGEKKSHVY